MYDDFMNESESITVTGICKFAVVVFMGSLFTIIISKLGIIPAIYVRGAIGFMYFAFILISLVYVNATIVVAASLSHNKYKKIIMYIELIGNLSIQITITIFVLIYFGVASNSISGISKSEIVISVAKQSILLSTLFWMFTIWTRMIINKLNTIDLKVESQLTKEEE